MPFTYDCWKNSQSGSANTSRERRLLPRDLAYAAKLLAVAAGIDGEANRAKAVRMAALSGSGLFAK